MQCYLQALNDASEIEDLVGQREAYANIRQITLDRNELIGAEKALSAALALGEATHDSYTIGRILSQLRLAVSVSR